MAGRALEIEGQRFGRLTVKRLVGVDANGQRLWRCKCDCGGEAVARATLLRQGRVQSCGCLRSERSKELVSALNASRRAAAQDAAKSPLEHTEGRRVQVGLAWEAERVDCWPVVAEDQWVVRVTGGKTWAKGVDSILFKDRFCIIALEKAMAEAPRESLAELKAKAIAEAGEP